MKIFYKASLVVSMFLALCLTISAYAADVTFLWDAYPSGETLTSKGGFKLYRRNITTNNYDYTKPYLTLNNPTATTTGKIKIPNENAFFVLRAFDYTGGTSKTEYIESPDSNQVYFTPAFGEQVKFLWVPDSPYNAEVSVLPDRSSARRLTGRAITDTAYIFVTPETGVTSISFYLNDPLMENAPRQTEGSAPFDFAGGTTEAANPFDTKTIPNGIHTLTLKVTKSDSTQDIIHVPFIIANP